MCILNFCDGKTMLSKVNLYIACKSAVALPKLPCIAHTTCLYQSLPIYYLILTNLNQILNSATNVNKLWQPNPTSNPTSTQSNPIQLQPRLGLHGNWFEHHHHPPPQTFNQVPGNTKQWNFRKIQYNAMSPKMQCQPNAMSTKMQCRPKCNVNQNAMSTKT